MTRTSTASSPDMTSSPPRSSDSQTRIQEIEAEARTPRTDEALGGLRSRHDELTAVIDDLKTQIQAVKAESKSTRRDKTLDCSNPDTTN